MHFILLCANCVRAPPPPPFVCVFVLLNTFMFSSLHHITIYFALCWNLDGNVEKSIEIVFKLFFFNGFSLIWSHIRILLLPCVTLTWIQFNYFGSIRAVLFILSFVKHTHKNKLFIFLSYIWNTHHKIQFNFGPHENLFQIEFKIKTK